MMRSLFLFLILCSSVLMSCKAQTNSELLGKWYHYREKEALGEQLFVKKGNEELPPARFRQYFYFKPDGSCEYNLIAPTDGRKIAEGKYSVKDDSLQINGPDGMLKFRFKILEHSSGKLRLKER